MKKLIPLAAAAAAGYALCSLVHFVKENVPLIVVTMREAAYDPEEDEDKDVSEGMTDDMSEKKPADAADANEAVPSAAESVQEEVPAEEMTGGRSSAACFFRKEVLKYEETAERNAVRNSCGKSICE